MVFITDAEADDFAGYDWRNQPLADKAVLLANTWLDNRGLSFQGEVPQAVKEAAGLLVQMAAEGKLYADTQTGLLSESVRAGDVGSRQTFSAQAKFISGRLQMVEALIKPYAGLSGRANVRMLVRM